MLSGFRGRSWPLPGDYAGRAARCCWPGSDGELAGCCALRPIEDVDCANAAEMKRLYVRKAFRGFGLGRRWPRAVLEAAVRLGYDSVLLLDTLLDDMESARALYEDLGFEEIPPYYPPLPGRTT